LTIRGLPQVSSKELFKWRLESAQKYDESERSLGDVLDVKASVALVAVTFLAGVSGQLLGVQLLNPLWGEMQLVAQLGALLLLAMAGAFIVAELWPRDYVSLPTPQQDGKWIEELEKELADDEAVMKEVLLQKLSAAIKRVERNKEINDAKSRLLYQSFNMLAAAIVLVLGDLVLLALRALNSRFHA
jgi:hypothetical protein